MLAPGTTCSYQTTTQMSFQHPIAADEFGQIGQRQKLITNNLYKSINEQIYSEQSQRQPQIELSSTTHHDYHKGTIGTINSSNQNNFSSLIMPSSMDHFIYALFMQRAKIRTTIFSAFASKFPCHSNDSWIFIWSIQICKLDDPDISVMVNLQQLKWTNPVLVALSTTT